MHKATLVAWVIAGLLFAPPEAFSDPTGALPTVRVEPAAGGHGPLLLLMSGDGDWVDFMEELASAASAAGSPVLGLKSRSFLSEPRTPEAAAAALEPAVRDALAHWQRSELVIVGYSRGADMAPFVVNRWPEDLRARVRGMALIGLSEYASFEFHLDDLVRDVRRPTDLPTRPEVEKLAGLHLVCVRGERERDSFCDQPTAGMEVATHAGAHRATSDDGSIAAVLHALGLAR
jgi:type IV secretory pathway VirJ component